MVQVELLENNVVAERLAGRQSFNTSDQLFVPTNASDNMASDGALLLGTVYQKDAPDDLKVVSWPKNEGIEDVDDLDYYAHERNSGQHSAVYVVEEGIDPSNTVRSYPCNFRTQHSKLVPLCLTDTSCGRSSTSTLRLGFIHLP